MSVREEIQVALEAILFVAAEPVARERLVELFGPQNREAAEQELGILLQRYAPSPERGIYAEDVAGGIRLVTRPDLHGYLRKFFEVTGRTRLSLAALETLAIVAYRQPITAPEVQELRGVSSAGVLRTLLERRLIRISGRKQVVGKPFLYRTTREFLMHFGLESLDDLPPLEEFEDALGLSGEGAGGGSGSAAGETEARPEGEIETELR